MPESSDVLRTTSFDPLVFWEQHKIKVVAYVALLVVGVVIFGLYEYTNERRTAEVERLFSQAYTANAYREVADKFPRTVAGGDAELMLAASLRNEKKYDEAAATLKSFIDHNGTHPLIDGAWISLAA